MEKTSLRLPTLAIILVTILCACNLRTDSSTSVDLATTAPPNPIKPIEIGYEVGNKAPEFTLGLINDKSITSHELLQEEKPIFLFFFTTWCSICRTELRDMSEIYPPYSDKINFYAVGQDPTENIGELENFRIEQGHQWPIAKSNADIVKNFRILEQSTKITIDSSNNIIHREGYGRGDKETWDEAFRKLSKSTFQ